MTHNCHYKINHIQDVTHLGTKVYLVLCHIIAQVFYFMLFLFSFFLYLFNITISLQIAQWVDIKIQLISVDKN